MKLRQFILFFGAMILYNIFFHNNYPPEDVIYDSILFAFSKWMKEGAVYIFNLHKLVHENYINILLFDTIIHDLFFEFLNYYGGNKLGYNKKNFENVIVALITNYYIDYDYMVLDNFVRFLKNLFSSKSFQKESLESMNKNITLVSNQTDNNYTKLINSLPDEKTNDTLSKIHDALQYDFNDILYRLKPNIEFIYSYSILKETNTKNLTYVSSYDNYKIYHDNVLTVFCDYSIDFISNLLLFIQNVVVIVKDYLPIVKYIDYTLFCLASIRNAYIYTTTTAFQPEHYFSLISMFHVILIRVNVLTSRLSLLFNSVVLINSYYAYKNIVDYFLNETKDFIIKSFNEKKYINNKFPKKPKFLEIN